MDKGNTIIIIDLGPYLTVWRNKLLVPDHKRNADTEMIDLGLSTSDIITILESGTEIKKRKKGIIEKDENIKLPIKTELIGLKYAILELCKI